MLAPSVIDYNMPITMAYMKHMKLRLLGSRRDEVGPHELTLGPGRLRRWG